MSSLFGLLFLLTPPAPVCRDVQLECRVQPLEQGRAGEVVRVCRVVRICEVSK